MIEKEETFKDKNQKKEITKENLKNKDKEKNLKKEKK